MAGGNRFKHRSLGGGLVPNNQQAPSNNFYAAAPPEPSILEKALQLAQALGDASSEYTVKANADPGNRLSPFGAVPTQFIKDSAKHLWDEKFGLVPAKKAWDSGSALADILSGKEQSTPFASVQGTQLAGDAANNAAIAALDASTLIPGMGVVPKMGKGVGKAAASVADDVPKIERVLQDANKLTPPTGPKPVGFDDWAPEYQQAYDKGLDLSTEARMARAREQGFNVDRPVYHGMPGPMEGDHLRPTNHWNVTEPKAISTIDDPKVAASFADESGQIFPMFYRGKLGDHSEFSDEMWQLVNDNAKQSGNKRASWDDARSVMRQRYEDRGFTGTHSNLGEHAIFDPVNLRSPSAAFDPDNIGKPTMLGMGFPFSGKDGEKPLLSALMDAFKGKPKESPLDQFTPPTTLDDIFTGGAPRGPREITGGAENPAGLDGSAFNLNTPDVPYDPARGFQGLDARFAADKNAKTLSEALAKRAKPPGYDDWSPEWRAAYDKGLDMSQEARMARAREQGFTTPIYHGTFQDFPAFDTTRAEDGIALGSHFGTKGQANERLMSLARDKFEENSRVMPLLTNIKNPVRLEDMSKWTAEDVLRQLDNGPRPIKAGNQSLDYYDASASEIQDAIKKAGHDGIIYNNRYEGDGDSLIAFDPANIRSVNAAFDPANAGKSNLLGAGMPADDLIKLLMAYGAFGGMSAGALATMESQKHQQGGM